MLRLVLFAPALAIVALVSQQPASSSASGTIPADAATLVNPVKPTAEGTARAKKFFGQDCAVCHGAQGDGKGDIAADMKPPMKDFTDPATLKDLPDGQLFYIIRDGKGMMPSEGARLKTNDVWDMVILVRSFAKKT
jgi:mono/diheme cytochrome c family protein